jgi:hypothetical protein
MSLWAALLGGAASLAGGAFNNRANAHQAALQRDFAADQATITRDFNSREAQLARDFNAEQADVNRQFQSAEAVYNRDFQAQQAQVSRDYQTEMSNTAYQRATADMTAAGINPMLAYMKGGASTPPGATAAGAQASGSQASGGAASSSPASGVAARQEDVLTPALNTALQIRMNQAQVQLLENQAFKAKAEGYTELRRPPNVDADTDRARAQAGLAVEQQRIPETTLRLMGAQIGNILADTKVKDAQESLTLEQVSQAVAQTKLIGHQSATEIHRAINLMKQGDLFEAQTILARLQQPEARATASFYESTGETTRVVELARILTIVLKSVLGK